MNKEKLEYFDPEVNKLISLEAARLEDGLELIASENAVSPAVLQVLGSVLTNKYAEGYPAKRYYGGCEYVDEIERLAIERVKQIFGAEHANVQPHSGSQANQAVFFALMQPGDTYLSLSLSHGGHLTHGAAVNFSGMLYKPEFYYVDKDGYLDFNEIEEKALALKPKVIIAGATVYPRVIDFSRFRKIADKVGAFLMVDMAHIAGLVAGGQHPSPIPFADVVTSTTHKTLRGPRGGIILCRESLAKTIDKAIFPGLQGGPLMNNIAAKAVAFKEVLMPEFKEYSEQIVINAKALAQTLMSQGVKLISKGTDNHLMLVDLSQTELSGKDAEARLAKIKITVNKNSIPNDPRKPMVTSGIRIGTPAVTTRGLKAKDMEILGNAISLALRNDDSLLEKALSLVEGLCKKYPVYGKQE
ncbi:MAG: serine hydroxymethyltransferase [Silvanigrellaceae bacterium]|nr:serine hydroxymethyltransferase [Silvanigrellaceae bacterium]